MYVVAKAKSNQTILNIATREKNLKKVHPFSLSKPLVASLALYFSMVPSNPMFDLVYQLTPNWLLARREVHNLLSPSLNNSMYFNIHGSSLTLRLSCLRIDGRFLSGKNVKNKISVGGRKFRI